MARNVRSRVTLFTRRIKELEQAQIEALKKTTEYLHTEVVQAQVVPRDTGALQNEKFFADYSKADEGRTALIFEGPYARRLYYHPEYNFQHDENPNAKGKWMEDWAPGGKKEQDVREAYKEHYKREAGL